jgi:hypothetical protein
VPCCMGFSGDFVYVEIFDFGGEEFALIIIESSNRVYCTTSLYLVP